MFPSPQRSIVLLFDNHTHFLPASNPSSAPGNHSPVFHLYNFAITRMLYKWNHTLNNLLRLALFTQLQSHRIHPGVECIYYLFSLLSSIPCCGWTTVCSTIHPWKGTCAVSSLWLIGIKLLGTCIHRFNINMSFYFSGINTRSMIADPHDNCMCGFIRKCQMLSRGAL